MFQARRLSRLQSSKWLHSLFYSTIAAPTQGLFSANSLACLSVPTTIDTNSFNAVFAYDVLVMAEIWRILAQRDRSIDSSLTDRTEPKAQLRELVLMSSKLSALKTIASASRVYDIPRTHSYLDTNSSTVKPFGYANPLRKCVSTSICNSKRKLAWCA